MKILIGMTRSDTIVSGSFKHITQIGQRFRESGAEVVYVIGGKGPAIDSLMALGFEVISMPNLKRNLSPFYDFLSVLRLIWIIFKIRPNLCSFHTAKIGALGRIAAFITGKKSFYVPHGVPFALSPHNSGQMVYGLLEKVLAFLPGRIIGVCEYDRSEYERIGVKKEKVKVIYNGMASKNSEMASKNLIGSKIRFITSARFEKQKDYKTLANACRKLIEFGYIFNLDIYGDGAQELEIREMFRELPENIIQFKGVVPDFSQALVSADVFVLSSHWEGLPRSIIEAMSLGLPIICSDVGGCSELVQPQVNGYLVATEDVEGMVKAMQSYLDDARLINSHGQSSLESFNKRFTLERMLHEYEHLYSVTASKTNSAADANF